MIGETGVDESVDADLVFPSGATARARSSMADAQLLIQATVRGSRAVMTLDNFIGPHYGNVDAGARWPHLGDDRPGHVLEESFAGETTYWTSCERSATPSLGGPPLPSRAGAVANMMLIDAVRAAAQI